MDSYGSQDKKPVKVFLAERNAKISSSRVNNSDLYLIIESEDISVKEDILLAPLTARQRGSGKKTHPECNLAYFVRESDPISDIKREFELDYLDQILEHLERLSPVLEERTGFRVTIGTHRYDSQKIREFRGIVDGKIEARASGKFPEKPSSSWSSRKIAQLMGKYA